MPHLGKTRTGSCKSYCKERVLVNLTNGIFKFTASMTS